MNNEQIKKNLIAKEKIESDADHPQKMRDVKPSVLASLFNIYGGGCVNCFGYVSEPNLKFYSHSVEKVLCYKCQEMTRTEDDYPPAEEMIYSQKQNEEQLTNYQSK